MNKRILIAIVGIICYFSSLSGSLHAQDGKLFIIGGGKRPPALVEEMVKASGLDKRGSYGVILPMSSSEPDTAAYYAIRQFTELGIPREKLTTFQFPNDDYSPEQLDSINRADLIYMTGGDQRRFMRLIEGTDVKERVQDAYNRGATIAGTSAGAALMSEQMLTGDQRKHPEYTGYFRTIEADNMILKPGLGLLDHSVIDQHFIRRMRLNRLLSVVIEHPDLMGIGIDESTAILVDGPRVRVLGIGQVIVIQPPKRKPKVKNGLLGARDLTISVLLPGDAFKLNN